MSGLGPTAPVTPGRRRFTARLAALLLGSLVALVALGALMLRGYSYYGGPLWDEWHCSEGERVGYVAPNDSSRVCVPPGEDIPPIWVEDPLGNRPFECENRRGWVPLVHSRTGARECMREGDELPEIYREDGWVIDQAQWEKNGFLKF